MIDQTKSVAEIDEQIKKNISVHTKNSHDSIEMWQMTDELNNRWNTTCAITAEIPHVQ